MDLSLNGKTALVTGSSRGTGLIIAAHLAREGATVYVHGLEPGQAQAAVDDIGVGIPVTGDIRTDAGAATLFANLPRALDILVNNYGAASRGSWSALDTDAWIEAYQTNVLSAQRCVRALLPAMQERGWGRIVNLGTVGSTRPAERMPHYYAAKGALATMTVSLAKAVAGSGVTVNLVSPGLIRTPEVEAAWLERGVREGLGDTFEAIEPQLAQDIPIRRIARREEVADLVAFLVSPLAGAIHGQNIRIDGGALGTVT
jgi:NAD(P)-dependent dehydrogenase (short-subunit alcohol dehydrogenase family)